MKQEIVDKITNEILRIKAEIDDLEKSIKDGSVDVGENFMYCLLQARAELFGANAALTAKQLDAKIKSKF